MSKNNPSKDIGDLLLQSILSDPNIRAVLDETRPRIPPDSTVVEIASMCRDLGKPPELAELLARLIVMSRNGGGSK